MAPLPAFSPFLVGEHLLGAFKFTQRQLRRAAR